MKDDTDRRDGTYWRIAWSRDWRTRTPWSLDKVDMPYIGWRRSHKGPVTIRVFGPLALISVTIG